LSQSAVEEYRVWLAAGYFDESFDEFEDSTYTVAGFVGNGLDALSLDLQWKEVLVEYNLDYFKASEIELGFGQFRQYRDDPSNLKLPLSKREKDLIREIKTAFIDVICEHQEFRGIGACLLMRDYRALKEELPDFQKRLPLPYVLCSDIMLVEAGLRMSLTNQTNPSRPGVLRPVFDSHKDYAYRFMASYELFCVKNPNCSISMLPPIFEDDQDYRCLQAADCLAYEARKLLFNTYFDPERDERVAMTRLKDNVVDVLYLLDYENLKTIALKQRVPDERLIEPHIDNHRVAIKP
jgi:hypothetical protein